MEWPLEQTDQGTEGISQANQENIRFFTVPRHASTDLEPHIDSQWKVSSSESAKDFSAVAYYFGKKLFQQLEVPIGLIHSSWGGSNAESWTSEDYLKRLPEFRVDSQDTGENAGALINAYQSQSDNRQPSKLYNGMIHPLIPYQIKGTIWYQGEANRMNANLYERPFSHGNSQLEGQVENRRFPFLLCSNCAFYI